MILPIGTPKFRDPNLHPVGQFQKKLCDYMGKNCPTFGLTHLIIHRSSILPTGRDHGFQACPDRFQLAYARHPLKARRFMRPKA